jgi:hypothetical protein
VRYLLSHLREADYSSIMDHIQVCICVSSASDAAPILWACRK